MSGYCALHDIEYITNCERCAKERPFVAHNQREASKRTATISPEASPAEHDRVNALLRQEGGNHYKGAKIQPVEFIVANDIPFREGNVIKYVYRHKQKNGLEDLKKAKHYLEMLIQEYDK